MTLRQTANSENETSAVCLQLSVQESENICICIEKWHFFLFLCDIFEDHKKRIQNQKHSLPFVVCRKSLA